MKKLFLMLSFVAVTVFCSDRKGNQAPVYDKSQFKNGFFGGIGLLEVKKFESNRSADVSTIEIRKKENENEEIRTLSCGFSPKSECSFKDLLKNRFNREDLTIKDFKKISCDQNSRVVVWVPINKENIFPVITEYLDDDNSKNKDTGSFFTIQRGNLSTKSYDRSDWFTDQYSRSI